MSRRRRTTAGMPRKRCGANPHAETGAEVVKSPRVHTRGATNLAWRCRTCCLRANRNSRPLRYLIFRGSIPHPMQSLCTLRDYCRQEPRNTRYQADATPYLGRTSAGCIAPACGWRTYSITSSASASNLDGTSTSSAFAVLRDRDGQPVLDRVGGQPTSEIERHWASFLMAFRARLSAKSNKRRTSRSLLCRRDGRRSTSCVLLKVAAALSA